VTPPQPKCRNDCTSCGDGHVDPNDNESCDDGNTVSGCDPMHPTVPLDLCQNNCTPPICHDPAKIVLGRVISKLTIHGLLATATPVDLSARSFVLQLSDVSGHVLYRNSLEAGSLVGLADVGTYKYKSKTARVSVASRKSRRSAFATAIASQRSRMAICRRRPIRW
jgi:cysteine-rich repeat protein